jgi:hypothetical protein
MKIMLVLSLLTLAGCLGPALFTIAGFKITAGTAITVPAKIETYDKYKND